MNVPLPSWKEKNKQRFSSREKTKSVGKFKYEMGRGAAQGRG